MTEKRGTDEEEANRRSLILDKMEKDPVKWEDFREIIEASEPWDPIQWPENHDWFMIRKVPMTAFRGITLEAVADVEDPAERKEHRQRYQEILKMLKDGAAPWPVIVADTGMIVDGYHRLAALRKLKATAVDVLYVIV